MFTLESSHIIFFIPIFVGFLILICPLLILLFSALDWRGYTMMKKMKEDPAALINTSFSHVKWSFGVFLLLFCYSQTERLYFQPVVYCHLSIIIYCYYSLIFTNKCSNYQIMSFHLNYTLVKMYSRSAICSHILHPHTPTRHIDFFHIYIWLVNFGMALYYELLIKPHINSILTYCFLRNIVWSHFPLQQEATCCF